jgi:hypothetical protein
VREQVMVDRNVEAARRSSTSKIPAIFAARVDRFIFLATLDITFCARPSHHYEHAMLLTVIMSEPESFCSARWRILFANGVGLLSPALSADGGK